MDSLAELRDNRAMSDKTLEYVHLRRGPEGDWIPVEELIIRMPPEEMAIGYASQTIRLKSMEEAESNLKNYYHNEPMKIGGRTKIVEIKSALEDMRAPLLIGMTARSGTSQAIAEIKEILPVKSEYRTKRLVGLQLLTSIGWLSDITRARPPGITEDTSSVDYDADLLPENLEVKDENAPSGYNKIQAATLAETQKISVACLEKCGNLQKKIAELTIVKFGEIVYRTYSRLFTSLPDTEAEERARFEEMRKAAEAKREAEND